MKKLICAVTVLVFSTAQADTIYVDASCPGGNGSELDPYCSIQTAIDNAVDTDEIVVAPGTYLETVNFLGKAITLRSIDGPDVTAISAVDSVAVLFDSGETRATVIEGFAINSATSRAMTILSSSPTVSHCVFVNNPQQGAISIATGSPLIEWCRMSNNTEPGAGGGLFIGGGSTAEIRYCIISNNFSGNLGGGIKVQNGSDVTILNSMIVNNTAVQIGGGIRNIGSTITLVGCVISFNQSINGNGGGIRNSSGHVELRNCIVWSNSPNQISNVSGATADVAFSCVDGGFAGAGNIELDPLFANVALGDFRLQGQSPCIDAGDNTAVPSEIAVDLDENPRFADVPEVVDTGNGVPPLVDIGAYEVPPPPCAAADVDEDGDVGIGDFLLVLAQWGPCPPQCLGDFDGDGIVGINDFLLVLANWGPCP